jgi:hypothetical protein
MSDKPIEKGCTKCGITSPSSAESPDGSEVYWFGTPKGKKDFVFLLSNLNYSFYVSMSKKYPENKNDEYDFYCIDCFIKLFKESGYYNEK